ncbi:hypothetical protein IJ076_01955 [Candidatus Saccharibacteria bacterium]|nr:hypothetical protein [Candidatus Saccharibacteria bacterium]
MDSLKTAPVQSEIISNNNQELGKVLQNPSDADVSKISGLTIALYIGSILLLAGVGGLVFSGAKIPGLILLTTMMLVFYIGGILARNSEALKTASHVFVGTGMIMLPFLGFLFYDTIKIDASIIWLIMSLIGVPIYIFAAYVMQNKIFSFFYYRWLYIAKLFICFNHESRYGLVLCLCDGSRFYP